MPKLRAEIVDCRYWCVIKNRPARAEFPLACACTVEHGTTMRLMLQAIEPVSVARHVDRGPPLNWWESRHCKPKISATEKVSIDRRQLQQVQLSGGEEPNHERQARKHDLLSVWLEDAGPKRFRIQNVGSSLAPHSGELHADAGHCRQQRLPGRLPGLLHGDISSGEFPSWGTPWPCGGIYALMAGFYQVMMLRWRT